MRKLKYTEVSKIRGEWLTQQDHKCLLCSEPIGATEAVLDHCHKSGTVRGVLHRGCNALLGKLENNLARNKITPLMLHTFLLNAEDYIQRTSELRHPTHCTPEEKKVKAKARAKRKKPV